MSYYGDYQAGQTVTMYWETTTASGQSVTRATNGTVYVKKVGGAQTTTGVTDSEDAIATGVHIVTIATTDSYFTPGDYGVYVLTMTVDGVTPVNHYIGCFSIQNRYVPGLIARGVAQSGTSSTIVLAGATSFANDIPVGSTVSITYGAGVGQPRLIDDYVGATDTVTVSPAWQTNPDSTSYYEIYASAPASTTVANYPSVNVAAINGTAIATPHSAGYMPSTVKPGTGTGEIDLTTGFVKAKNHLGDTLATDAQATAIKAKTDGLTFDVAGYASVNVRYMNSAQVNGIGTSGDKWRGA